MAKDKDKVERRYFVHVGAELIEIPSDHIGEGRLSTSAPIRQYRVRGTVNDVTYEGFGDSWKSAETDLDNQVPK